MTGRPSSASRAAWWLNGMLASRGISPQMLSCSGAEREQRGRLAAARADLAAHVLYPGDAEGRCAAVAAVLFHRLQVRDQPARVLVRDDLRRDHHKHAHRAPGQSEYELLDVRRPRRQVHHQVVQVGPVRIGQQPADEQLGDTAADGQGPGSRRAGTPPTPAALRAGVTVCSRESAAPWTGEQRHVRRLGTPPQAHHARHVRAVQVGVDQAGARPLRGQRQGEVDARPWSSRHRPSRWRPR